MADYEQYYRKSITALTELIRQKRDVPTEKEWNHLAGTDNYLTSQSLGFIAQAKFSEICKKIYREIQKQNKKEKMKQ